MPGRLTGHPAQPMERKSRKGWGCMSSAITVVRVTKENYSLFDALALRRYRGWNQSEADPVPPRDNSQAAEALADSNLRVYAAVCDGKWVGWITLLYVPKVGRTNGRGYLFVEELWTHPEYRRKGVARSLMAQADDERARREALGIRLMVSPDNREAIRLCQACGYADLDMALCMEKNPGCAEN